MDPFCRVVTPSISEICKINCIFPQKITVAADAVSKINEMWNSKSWNPRFSNYKNFFESSYQPYAQLALYWMDEEKFYPRFGKRLEYHEISDYLKKWFTKYYSPNPYSKAPAGFVGTPYILNNYINNFIITENGNGNVASFQTCFHNMFGDDIGNLDILKNIINEFSDYLVEDNGVIRFKDEANAHELIDDSLVRLPENVDCNDKSFFFHNFDTCYQPVDFNDFTSGHMKFSRQQIFFGAPGTGKSHEIKKQTADQSVVRTTFHPDSDYSTFVGAYKPTTIDVPLRDVSGHVVVENGNPVIESKIVYEFVEQAFLKAYVNAWTLLAENKPQFLIVEEINRGNCAQIFGDLFQLLDRNDFGFSDYPITADKDLQKHLKKAFENLNISGTDIEGEYEESNDSIATKVKSGEVLLLPKNLYIWATMNTSDQSLFPIDSAFKRRWDWKYIPIDTKKENWSIKVNGSAYSWSDFLEKVNEKIGSTTSSEDKKLGFYFCKACKNEISADRFVSKVLFYIYNDVFKDYGYEDPMFKNEGKVMPFQSFYNTDGSVNETVVKIILDNLDVVRDLEVDLPEDDFQKMDSSKFNEVVFSDGTIIKGKTQFETYQNTLEKIGIEKVAEIVAEKGWHRKSSLVVDSVQHDDIVNSKDFSYVQIDHYYVIKGVNTKSMMGYLKVINEKLGLGLKVQ
ncbi:AAA family ATPase [Fibrobacter sp. HC4]|uniref:AAA family ATPase n=1 Tax=Fibrobacter sp. HC4 TaxID=3239812 RepID=UPI002019CD4F|nr:AAA family ATPase [Fibrobacter succinogenes]MCL4101723.1 hypothetical protein [Fibrobacter succinogenes]